jgi:hypothetical protein
VGSYDPQGALIWCLSGSGQSTKISGAGDSGGWGETPPAEFPASAVSLGRYTDVTIMAVATAITASPSWTVSLDLYDNQGNLIPAVLALTAVTAANTPKFASAGLHGPTAATFLVLPLFGRISWTLTGAAAAVSGAEISVWGR